MKLVLILAHLFFVTNLAHAATLNIDYDDATQEVVAFKIDNTSYGLMIDNAEAFGWTEEAEECTIDPQTNEESCVPVPNPKSKQDYIRDSVKAHVLDKIGAKIIADNLKDAKEQTEEAVELMKQAAVVEVVSTGG